MMRMCWRPFVEGSSRDASRYIVYLRDRDREVRAADFPARGHGRVVPWLVAGH